MFERVGEGVAAFDVSGAGSSVPGWAYAIIAAFLVVVFALAALRDSADRTGRSVMQIAAVLILVLAGWWALDDLNRRDVAAERRALEARAFELATRALTPGSALACLDPVAGDGVEDGCEKSLFATPEATAAAVGYVSAQLLLLASAGDHARGNSTPGPSNALANVRRSVEADRFGIVAHVLAVRDRCTPDRCAAFAYLQGTGRISANLAERPFDAYLARHMANWPAAGSGQVASNPSNSPPSNPPPAATASAATPKAPNNLYFPSSKSIPPVNIMTAEPQAPAAHDTTGTGQAADQATPPRKPQPAAQPTRQSPPAPAAGAAARSAPLQLSPGAQ